jgi:transposase
MEANTYVGLDIHRKSIVATALDSHGGTVAEAKLGPSTTELAAFLRGLPGTKHVVMEPCTIWEPLYESLEREGVETLLTNPLRTRLIADATIKTDRVDSQALATLLRLNAIPQIHVPDAETRSLRHLVRERYFYRQKSTALINRAYAELLRRGIEYPDRALRTVKGRQRIRALALPDVTRAIDTIEYLREKTKELDREIHTAYLRMPEAQWLKTIPGVGELAAVTLAAFLCPIERFPTIDRLSSYVGLAPSTHQSGEFCYQGKLKWDSNELLQWLLIEISWCHRLHAPRGTVAKVGARVSRRRGKGKGTVAAAHKLLKIIYAILKEKRAYRPHAPERPAAMQEVQDPPRVAAMQLVRGTALGSIAANRLSAQ